MVSRAQIAYRSGPERVEAQAGPRGVPVLARLGVPWRLGRSHGPFGMMGFDLLLLGEVLVVVGGEEGAYAAGAGGEDLLDEGRRVAGRLAWR